MKQSDAAALLTVASAFDNRKPDEATAQAWSLALEGINPVDARDAIVAHYRESRDWLMPADIRKRVLAVRRARLDAAGVRDIPAHIAAIDDDAEHTRQYHRWLRAENERIASGQAPTTARIELDPWDSTGTRGKGIRSIAEAIPDHLRTNLSHHDTEETP